MDGLLIRGQKGTAKSTAVRALTELLPRQAAVADCPYGCPPDDRESQCSTCRQRTDPSTTKRPVPLVTLPVGATRERVVGTLSVADALDGDFEFDPGLLAAANRGILYVDEINLLGDHLVDVLLDAAASGINTVERDGISVSHPANFTLIGTMNPEEGDLRPQLRDRFALQTTVTACTDIERRVEIINRAIHPSSDDTTPDDARERTDELRERLLTATEQLAAVSLSPELVEEIAELCLDADIDGHRGDIAIARAAKTFAALDDRTEVVESDLRRAAELALPHRLRSRPFEEVSTPDEILDDRFTDGAREPNDERSDGEDGERAENEDGSSGNEADFEDGETDDDDSNRSNAEASEPSESGSSDTTEQELRSGSRAETSGESQPADDLDENRDESGANEDATERSPLIPGESRAEIGTSAAPDLQTSDVTDAPSAENGVRSRTDPSTDTMGPRVRTRPADSSTDIDIAASVRTANRRGATNIESRDLRQSVRRGNASALVLFVVDASASMRPAMRAAKGTVLELLKDAYQHRDEVAFVAFAGEEANVVLPPTNSVSLAARHLKELPTGKRTPLPAGLRVACDTLDRADPAASVVVLVTDGRANVARKSPVAETRAAARKLSKIDPRVIVVDADDDRAGIVRMIVEETGGERIPLSALSADRIDTAVDTVREIE